MYEERIIELCHQKIELVSKYLSKRKDITLRCLECDHIWTTKAQNVMTRKYYCPHCGRPNRKQRIVLPCSYCGKEIERTPSEINSSKTGLFYCDRTCGNLHKNKIREASGEWEDSKNYRKKAYDFYGHFCSICLWDEDDRILEVHHIDENRENNNLENLRILCPTCHRKITLGYYLLDPIVNKLIKRE